MTKKVKNSKEREDYTVPRGRLKAVYLIGILLALAVNCAGAVQASDDGALDHVTTTYTKTKDTASPWQVAEMVCCHCVSYLSNGTRFYHGVIPIASCRAQKGHCEGEAKCFP